MNRHSLIGCLVCVLGLSVWSHAQATPTASRRGVMQLGLGGTLAKPDYDRKNIGGITVYGTFDFTRHWGVEGDIHYVSLFTPSYIGQDSYLLGPRYAIHHNRITGYAKVLGGLGRFTYQYDYAPHATFTYKIYSMGAGLDVRATQHFNVRAFDFEYQQWPGFPENGLSPIVMTIGAAYAFR